MAHTHADPEGPINPLKKVSKALFEHGKAHLIDAESTDKTFDRLVAGVHIDNALELFLKFYGFQHDIRQCDRKQVPELITDLGPYLPDLATYAGDLRTFHNLRNGTYHSGTSLDDHIINWGISIVGSFVESVEHREAVPRTMTDGGTYEHSSRKERANKELEVAARLFSLSSLNADYPLVDVLFHVCRAVELYVDGTLESNVQGYEPRASKTSLRQKLEMLKEKGIIRDPVLLSELLDIVEMRNLLTHAKEKNITIEQVNRSLQIATHFIKIKEPSLYVSNNTPSHRTLTNSLVRSKSELIIANILEGLGLKFEYEKPLFSTDGSSRRICPDFTITYRGRVYYWEHLSSVSANYSDHWQNRLQWYKDNGYFDRLIVSTESSQTGIDSLEITKLAKERILRSHLL